MIIFEILLNGCALFNHGNFSLPNKVEKIVKYFLVTPDIHRIHHSVDSEETHSNFGFSTPIWDKIFGTFNAVAVKSQTEMVIGLTHVTDKDLFHPFKMLTMPFDSPRGEYLSQCLNTRKRIGFAGALVFCFCIVYAGMAL